MTTHKQCCIIYSKRSQLCLFPWPLFRFRSFLWDPQIPSSCVKCLKQTCIVGLWRDRTLLWQSICAPVWSNLPSFLSSVRFVLRVDCSDPSRELCNFLRCIHKLTVSPYQPISMVKVSLFSHVTEVWQGTWICGPVITWHFALATCRGITTGAAQANFGQISLKDKKKCFF